MITHTITTEFGKVTIRQRNGRWYARKQHAGQRLEKCMASFSEDQAAEEAAQWLAQLVRGIVDVETTGEPSSRYVDRLFKIAKRRAVANGTPYSLTPEEESSLYIKAAGQCAITGLRFRMGRGSGYRAPFAPSIDRIDSNKGYTTGNVRLVCVAVNWALSDWGEGVFRQICAAYAAKLLREVSGGILGQENAKY